MWAATAALATAGRLRKRAADRAVTESTGTHHATEDALRRRWGGVPTGATGLQPWAEAAAGKRADTDHRVTQSRRHAQQTHREQHHLAERHLRESALLRRRVLGFATPSTASTRAAQWRTRADQARRDLAEMEALPVTEAAQLVRERAARAEAELEAAERAQASRDMRAVPLGQFESPSTDHGTKGQERDAPGL